VLAGLRIRNYAVIDELDLEFTGGFVAFTGETGAGKSIVVGALALVLGGRARPEQLRSGADEMSVEVRFIPPFGEDLAAICRDAGIDMGGELLLRRIVPAAGKSRAFVNDRAVTAGTLEAIGRELVDIHGQHQHQSLLRTETHLDFLDGYAGLLEEREEFASVFRKWQQLAAEKRRLAAREREKGERIEFLRFQKNEIERAGISPGEDAELERQRERLRHAGRLAEASGEAEALIYSGEAAAAAAASRAAERLRELSDIDPALEELAALLEQSQLQLEEAGREIQSYHRGLDADPALLEETDNRLAEINALKRKHGGTLEGVFDRLEEIERETAELDDAENRLAELAQKTDAAEKEVVRRAGRLSSKRAAARKSFEKKVLLELKGLNLGGSSFEVSLDALRDAGAFVETADGRTGVDERGCDSAEFLLTTNTGEPLKPLARVASGGELSRVMLALKTVLSGVDEVPTLVFDEVDIGIGGATARLVGDRLAELASGRQVLCITHLPQIASLADSHYNISKTTVKGRTRVSVRMLDAAGRVEEVARMLGGTQVTAATKKHASELLGAGG
jgi:DNA repair protein RecN (Recombination protein N)